MLLTEHEAHQAYNETNAWLDDPLLGVAKAQLKAVVGWGQELCNTVYHNGYGNKKRFNCYHCQQALLEEVDGS